MKLMKLQLYSFFRSSCSWRVRIALSLRGLEYEYKAVNLWKREQFSPEFSKLNPLCYVPVLVDGDIVVSDSFAILLVVRLCISIAFVSASCHVTEITIGGHHILLEVTEIYYLEEKYPEHPLLPCDLQKKAINFQAANIVWSSMQPFQNDTAVVKHTAFSE